MIKAAIIGLGKMGMSHAAILGGLPNVEMAAIIYCHNGSSSQLSGNPIAWVSTIGYA